MRWNGWVAACAAVTLSMASSSALAALVVAAASPAPGEMNVAATAKIRVVFNQPVATSTVLASDFHAFGRSTGPVAGTLSFSNGNRTVTLTPNHPFAAGETVLVVLSHNLKAADNTPLRAAGYSYSFVVEAGRSDMVFQTIDTMSNRIGSAQTRIYGAMSTDVNHDRYPDLTTVNEVSADLRVFLNRADGTGLYDPWLQPPFPIGVESSPNEPADFDRDGDVDIVVVSAAEDLVLIARGNGDGTFGSPQEIALGAEPQRRGGARRRRRRRHRRRGLRRRGQPRRPDAQRRHRGVRGPHHLRERRQRRVRPGRSRHEQRRDHGSGGGSDR
jgi:hypothetical protein